MKPFEIRGPDDRLYIHEDNWNTWRDDLLEQYPANGKMRFDVTVEHCRRGLRQVPIDHNPHHHGNYDGHTCFYCSGDWSTIFGVHFAFKGERNGDSLRFIIESGNRLPVWGTQIILWSTSSYIQNEPWGWGVPNIFVSIYPGMHWKVTNFIPLQEWAGGAETPKTDGRVQQINGLYNFTPANPAFPIDPAPAVGHFRRDLLPRFNFNIQLDEPANEEIEIIPFPLPLPFPPGMAGNIMQAWGEFNQLPRE